MAEQRRRLKHWGWGYEDQQRPQSEVEQAAAGIRQMFGFGGEAVPAVPLDQAGIRTARLKPPAGGLFTDDLHERAVHGLGKAYRDVVRGHRGEFPCPPDLVAFPEDEAGVEQVFERAAEWGAAVIPFGGGTSVVGGIEPRLEDEDRPTISLDLGRLDSLFEVDRDSLAARMGAGMKGPALEDRLRAEGLTLRHYPQSFEYSTLGGWIATRAGGHFATGETHIDDLVESVRAITPSGEWQSRRLPGSGAGPSPDRMLIGSEGTLGVITEAWMRVRPRPVFKASATLEFEHFATAAFGAVRAIAQSRLGPSNCRLIDPLEAATMGAGDGSATLLLLGFESAEVPVGELLDQAVAIAVEHGGNGRCAQGDRTGLRRRSRPGGRGRQLWRRPVAKRIPHGPLPARCIRQLRCAFGDLRERDHLGPLRGVPRRGRPGDPQCGCRSLRDTGRR